MDNTGSSVGWFAVGAILGAAVAMLYAPKSGKATRDIISQKADEGQKAVTESGKDIVDKGKNLYERGRQIAEEAAELFERGRQLVRG